MSNLHHEIFSLCQQVIHNIPRDSHLIFPGRSPLPVAVNLKKIIPERVSNIPISRLHDMKSDRELPKDLKAHFDTWLNINNESTIVVIDYVESGVSLYNFYKLLDLYLKSTNTSPKITLLPFGTMLGYFIKLAHENMFNQYSYIRLENGEVLNLLRDEYLKTLVPDYTYKLGETALPKSPLWQNTEKIIEKEYLLTEEYLIKLKGLIDATK